MSVRLETDGELALGDLSRDDVHIWLTQTGDVDAALLGRHRALLDDAERAQADRFRLGKHAEIYTVAHALVRTTLSRYAPLAPADWRFVHGERGKPAVAPQLGAPPITFNLSHTDGLVGVAVTLERAVGFDVEDAGRLRRAIDIADRFFAATEVAELMSLPEARRIDRFFDYWTLKEAYIKARGLGLALPLGQFAFDVRARPIGVAFDSRLGDDPARWHFWQWPRPTRRHRAALAVETGGGRPPHVRLFETTPLGPTREVVAADWGLTD